MELKTRDLKQIMQDPEFTNLTVEQAIRLLGEKEKARIIAEREKLLLDLTNRLDQVVPSNRNAR